jgi:hypothetical protein
VTDSAAWRLPTRILFRFCVVYFGLYIATTGVLTNLLEAMVGARAAVVDHLAERLAAWAATHVFEVAVSTLESGSGDRMIDWIQVVCLLALALPATAVWSILDRHRPAYVRLHRWFTVVIRFALGATLLGYGAIKVIPVQMPAPSLLRLLEPLGDFSPMGVLWSSVGASFPYERVVGAVEMLGAILLFIPRTATLGAIICLADLVEVFTLNMTYDVPVKLYSFHLLLLAAFLLAPRAAPILGQVLVSKTRTRSAAVAQVALGVYLVGVAFYGASLRWHRPGGGGSPRPPFYGIWGVESMAINGEDRPPLLTDGARWRRLVFDRPDAVTVWLMNDRREQYDIALDPAHTIVTVTRGTTAVGSWTVVGPADGRLELDGDFKSQPIHVALHRDPEFQLLGPAFHWIQERPFNR